ncbi:MAG TPA: hypothetical protein VMT90_07950 [Dehalococcoidia bacterium]|jgi:hypothetical protein|nr:hypothetical protein [Dehalococcoidia bacterium]
MTTLPKFSGLRKAAGHAPAPAVAVAWLISAAVIASVTGFATYKLADSRGYDRGFTAGQSQGYEEGKAAGFSDGKAEGLKASQSKYDSGFLAGRNAGYSSGLSAGYDDGYDGGYDAAMSDATQVIEEYLPTIIQTAYNNGRASAPVYVPSFSLGSSTVYCTSTDLGSYTSVRCY